MIKKNCDTNPYFQAMTILMIGINAVLFLPISGYAEEPNVGPLLVHVVNPISGEKILPTTFPLPGNQSTTLKLSVCRGEYEPASFVFRATTRDVKILRFSPSNLIGESGIISKANVDIRVVKVWYQGGGGWNAIGLSHQRKSKVLVPELLLKDDGLVQIDKGSEENFVRLKFPSGNKLVSVSQPASLRSRILPSVSDFPIQDTKEIQPLTLKQNETKQLWITIYVPQDSDPGIYKGTIALSDSRGLLGELGIELRVLPFDLSPPKTQYSIYYRGRLSGNPTISSEQKNRTQFIAELENMMAHGVTNPTVYQRLNKEEIKSVLQIREQVGLDKDSLFYLGTGTGNPQEKNELAQLYRRVVAVKEIADEYGINNTYFYGLDEAKGEKLLSQRKAWDVVRQGKAKVFVAGYSATPSVVRDLLDLLIMAGKPEFSQAEELHRMGHRIFSYANPQVGPENPEIFRRNYGLELWKNSYDGAMPYAYQDSMGFIWNDFDHEKYRDHSFTYPTVDGVIDTLAWEGFREGIDDVRYVGTLEKALRDVRNSSDPVVAEASNFLRNLRNTTGVDLNETRKKVVFYILQVHGINVSTAPSMPKELIIY